MHPCGREHHLPPAWGRCSAVLLRAVMLSEARCTKLRSSALKALTLALSWDLEVILIDAGGRGSVALGHRNELNKG